jgi:thiosulfate dehydrogenase
MTPQRERIFQEVKYLPLWILAALVLFIVLPIVVLTLLQRQGDKPAEEKSVAVAPKVHAVAPPPASSLPEPDAGQTEASKSLAANAANVPSTQFTPPSEQSMPTGELGDTIKLGRAIFVHTQDYAKGLVGNGLNCVNCHLDAGRKADSAPLWAAYVMFPAYRDKNKKVNSFEDRLAGCFRFSMNGTAPEYNSKEMIALTAYSYWLAKGAPTGVELAGRGYPKLDPPALKADVTRGAQVYQANCAICHGADGLGTQVNGRYAFPPLWGKDSYNAGAGMHSAKNAAAFIKANMPLGLGNSLTIQQAWDVAEFVNSHDRPPDPRLKQ